MLDATPDNGLIAQARERFLARDGDLVYAAADVRQLIVASWNRSRESHVEVDRVAVPFVRDPDLEAPLVRSAAPILDTLGAQLSGEAVSIILTDQTGLVLDRRCSSLEITARLDAVRLAPGFSYAEQFAGTNGIGTALSSGGLTLVDGREHYTSELGQFACAGAPIRHPTHGRTIGVLDLTTWNHAPGAMLTALAGSTARQIEKELLAQTGLRELALFQEYMNICRHTPGPVLAVNNDVVMANDLLRRQLDPADQDSLIGYAMDTMRGGGDRTTARTVELPSGRSAHLRCTPAQCATGPAGGVFRVRVGPAERPPQGPVTPCPPVERVPGAFPMLVGTAPCWIRAVRQVDGCYRAGDWLTVEGEPGAGKLALLRSVHRRHRPSAPFRRIDPPEPEDLDAWLAALSDDLADPEALVVLAHADRLAPAEASAVAALLTEQAADLDADTRPRVAMTLNGPAPSALQPLFQRTVEIPALRHRIEDLGILVAHLLRQLTRDDQLTCSAQALAQFGRLNWPGNVAQLRRVLGQVVKQRRAGVIGLDDLPPECRSASRRTLSAMEAIERDAIVNALIGTSGNPTRAAEALGISRATVYRKLRAYGIRLPLTG